MLKWLEQAGQLNDHEFARTFNNGLGMILVSLADEYKQQLSESGERVFRVGHLAQRRVEDCVVQNMERWNA